MKYAVLLLALLVFDATARDRSVIREFRKDNPCPSTGRTTGACPGWVVDHGIPLCAGGADAPHNLFWQPRAASYVKDADERRLCRALAACKAPK